MKRHIFLLMILSLAVIGYGTMVYAGTTGKIGGRVTDAASGQPLVGANVIVEELMTGAIVDGNGEYAIINIPPGEYTLRTEMIGYGSVITSQVMVSVDLTTWIDFQLATEAIALETAVEIVATRAPVQMDLTSASAVVESDEINTLPVNEVDDVLSLQAGVVQGAFGELHIRGGRSDEVAYWVDGVQTTDVYEGGRGVEVQNSAVDELQVISGTFNAEYGQAMSGIVNIVTNAGGPNYEGSVTAYAGDHISNDDDLFHNIDDIDPLGQMNVEATLSGPIPATNKKLTFFGLGRYFDTDGYFFGKRIFNPDGSAGDSSAVPMAPRENIFLQGKVAWQAKPTLKLTYGLFLEDTEYKDYDHYFKYNPEATLNRFNDGQTHILTLTHTLSNNTFYELRGTSFSHSYKQYLYEDPYDSRYVHPDSLTSPADYSFGVGGTQMSHFSRTTAYVAAKADIISQVNKRHQVKAGIEYRAHELELDDKEVRPKTTGGFNEYGEWDELAGSEITPFEPTIHPIRSPSHDYYLKKPAEFSAYIQDKIEFREIILNIGLRFDYFDPDGQVLADPQDPDYNNPFLAEHIYKNYSPDLPDSQLVLYTPEERKEFWYNDVDAKTQISPRLGVAYPVTDRGAIHFSYGHFFQIPQFRYLYENPEFEVSRGSGLNTIVGNADLNPQKTVMYEIGMQQALSDVDVFDITMFYRDIRDWVGTSESIDTYVAGTAYSRYINKDYANARGVTLTYDRRFTDGFSAGMDYSYMVVEGTASDAADAYNAARDNRSPKISLIPLGWDQTHTLNTNLAVGSDSWRATLLGRFSTGTPYTPSFARGEISGSGQFTGLQENSERKPNNYAFDLKLFKRLRFGQFGYTVFLNVFNLFDRRNETGVYATTGRATYDLDAQNASDDANRPNTVEEYVNRPDYYTEPRRIQFGMTATF